MNDTDRKSMAELIEYGCTRRDFLHVRQSLKAKVEDFAKGGAEPQWTSYFSTDEKKVGAQIGLANGMVWILLEGMWHLRQTAVGLPRSALDGHVRPAATRPASPPSEPG